MRDIGLNRQLANTLGLGIEEHVDSTVDTFMLLDDDGASLSPLSPLTDEPITEAHQCAIVEQQQYLTELSNDFEQSGNDIETLESIQATLEDITTKGDTSVMSYEMFNIAMNTVYDRYGIKASNVLPSMEAFESDNELTTQISLEKLKGTVGAIAEGAMQLLKKIWFMTKKFMEGLFKYGRSVTRRAEGLAAYSAANDRTEIKKIKLYNAKKLEVDGKIPSKSDLLSLYKKASPNFDKITDIVAIQITAISDMVDGLLNGNIEGADKVILHSIAELKKAEYILNETLVFQGARVESIPTKLPSMKKLYPLPKLVFKSDGMDKRDDESTVYQIDCLTSQEVIQVTTEIVRSVNTLHRVKKKYANRDIDRYITLLVNAEYKLRDKKDKKDITMKTAYRIVSKALQGLLTFNNKYINYMMSVHKTVLDYCAQSAQVKSKLTQANNKQKVNDDD